VTQPARGSPRVPLSAASALVLAAGLGTRLRPLTLVRAKPALPLAGRPLVHRILERLARTGIRDVVLNLHHRPETLTGIVGEGRELGLSVRYSWEQPILGSAGGPRRALPLMPTDPFLLINGDTLLTVDLSDLWAHHLESDALVTMALVPNDAPERFGGVLVDEQLVTGFTKPGDRRPSFHFIGAQVVAKDAFSRLADGRPAETVNWLYPALIAERSGAVQAFVCAAPFLDVGTMADYRHAHEALALDEGRDPWTPGARSAIAIDAQLARTIVWDDVVVGEGAVLEDCVVADGVEVPPHATYRRCALIRAEDGLLAEPY
jgi:NDP-sugar pyrophosphorylase family protein